MKSVFLKVCAASLALFVLASCGSSTTAAPPVSTASLKGNWLVTGDLPVFGAGLPSPKNFGVAMTLDVINGQVFATYSNFYPCGNVAGGVGGVLAPATIASDGSFTLTTQSSGGAPTIGMSVNGNVPQTAGANWSGTYSATNSNSGCTPVGGAFTATPIPAVTGTFRGTGSLGAPNSTTSAPITLTADLTQGGPASLDPPVGSSSVNSVSALSGTISISGSPCFSNGTAKIPSGAVFGNRIGMPFAMDDGSTLLLSGAVKDTSSSSIALTSILVNGGACNGYSGSFGSILTRG